MPCGSGIRTDSTRPSPSMSSTVAGRRRRTGSAASTSGCGAAGRRASSAPPGVQARTEVDRAAVSSRRPGARARCRSHGVRESWCKVQHRGARGQLGGVDVAVGPERRLVPRDTPVARLVSVTTRSRPSWRSAHRLHADQPGVPRRRSNSSWVQRVVAIEESNRASGAWAWWSSSSEQVVDALSVSEAGAALHRDRHRVRPPRPPPRRRTPGARPARTRPRSRPVVSGSVTTIATRSDSEACSAKSTLRSSSQVAVVNGAGARRCAAASSNAPTARRRC